MTVKELIERLEKMPPDATVVYDAGRYIDTEVVTVSDLEFRPVFLIYGLKDKEVRNVVILNNEL